MTDVKKVRSIRDHIIGSSTDGITLEMRKTRIGAELVVTDILSIEEFSDERIVMATHKGRIIIHGTGLMISVFEKRCVEVFGRIERFEMGYGRT